MKITSLTLHFFEPGPLALLFPRQKKKNPQPVGGRKPLFNPAIFKERFNTIERVFGWEDKFRRLLLRFERLSQLHYAFKALAYTASALLPGLILQSMGFMMVTLRHVRSTVRWRFTAQIISK